MKRIIEVIVHAIRADRARGARLDAIAELDEHALRDIGVNPELARARRLALQQALRSNLLF